MESEILKFFALTLIFGTGFAIPVSIAWFEHRTRTRALDVLRVYAERGEDPPPSVTQPLTAVSGWGRKREGIGAHVSARANYLAHAAANTIFTIGLTGLAWWRFSASGEAGALVISAFLGALFFAAALAAQLVYAYHAPAR
ncbi:MAG TPA: hypothetical protein VFV95_18585 [Vicinamibacterales bacterium]|nr:hypothetical protein [Vicinamibacterales bacterium]